MLLALAGTAASLPAYFAEGNPRRIWLSIVAFLFFLAVLSYIWGDIARGPLRTLTDAQLREEVIAFANTLRDFEHNFHSEELTRMLNQQRLTGTEEEKIQKWQQQSNEMLMRHSQFQNEFKKRFLGKALGYRDELLRRLNIIAPTYEREVIAFQGMLAGVSPISDMANYLERLARQLP